MNYNGLDYTINCIKSLKKINYPNYEIIIVDNGSKNNEGKILKKIFPKEKVIASKKNHGFAEGNNIGYKYAKGEFIALLNNDTIVDKNWLSELILVFEDPSIAIVQSHIFAKFNKKDYYYDTNNVQSIVSCPVLNEKEYNKKGLKDIFFAIGCALIYPSKLLKEPFDKDYFCCCEDTALAFRARLMGYKVKEAKKSIIYHEGFVTMRKVSNLIIYLKEKNNLMNLLIFYEKKSLLKMFPLVLTASILRNLSDIRGIHMRIKSYFWLLINFNRILKKREKMQKLRKIKDSQLFKSMSYKFTNSETVSSKSTKQIVKLVNKLSHLYCYIFNIKTSEFYDRDIKITKF